MIVDSVELWQKLAMDAGGAYAMQPWTFELMTV